MTRPHFVEGKWTGPFVLPDIRESVGSDSAEKALLYELASHNNFTEIGTIKRILQWAGMGPNVFEKVRVALSELDLIAIELRSGATYRITLHVSALLAYTKTDMKSPLDDHARRAQAPARVGARRGAPTDQRPPSTRRSGKKNTATDKYAREWKPKPRAKQLDQVAPATSIKSNPVVPPDSEGVAWA